MSVQRTRLQFILPPLSSVMGLLALSGGIYGLMNPLAFSTTLGIPISTPSSPALPFVSFVAARNLGSGLTVLSLLYAGSRKAVGMYFMCGVSVILADVWICSQNDAIDGKALGHALMAVVSGLLGAGMYWG